MGEWDAFVKHHSSERGYANYLTATMDYSEPVTPRLDKVKSSVRHYMSLAPVTLWLGVVWWGGRIPVLF